jgi:hypothetical protein
MKKLILLLTICAYPCTSEALWWKGQVRHITSTDSTVLVFIDGRYGIVLYKINFDNSDRIILKEEKDSNLCIKIEEEYDRYRRCRYTNPYACSPELEVYRKADWEHARGTETDSLLKIIDWYNKYLSITINVYHITTKGDIWLGGDCFLSYYHNGRFETISYMDLYEASDIEVIFCETNEPCPDRDPEYPDPSYECFCDRRKIGYIQSENGYVNFSTKPDDICASSLGIILDKVRVFYWDDEDNPDWYRVEVNYVKGYVLKDNISKQQSLLNIDE